MTSTYTSITLKICILSLVYPGSTISVAFRRCLGEDLRRSYWLQYLTTLPFQGLALLLVVYSLGALQPGVGPVTEFVLHSMCESPVRSLVLTPPLHRLPCPHCQSFRTLSKSPDHKHPFAQFLPGILWI